ncbi:MAG: hypothetical protein FWH27_05020 [Planctomycetaceae bacterium]|nr:hypothetical protein [Planctomycetaceae bacterium]
MNLTHQLRLTPIALTILVVLFMPGCGSKYPKTIKVKAKVTLDGNPFPNAQVFLNPAGGDRGAMGISDGNGIVAAFSTFQSNDGVLPGTHKVSIMSKLPPPMPGTTTTPEQERVEREQRENPDNVTPPFPAKYQAGDTSGLTVTIDAKTKEISIEMTSN